MAASNIMLDTEETETLTQSSQHEDVKRTVAAWLKSGILKGGFGIIASYVMYANFQEELFRYSDPNGSVFRFALLVAGLEAFVNAVSAALMLYRENGGIRLNVPRGPIMFSGILLAGAKVTMSWALVAGLSYPVATMAKSSKTPVVMMGQVAFGGDSCSCKSSLFAILIVVGTVLVYLGQSHGESSSAATKEAGVEAILAIISSLVFDAVGHGYQKRVKAMKNPANPRETMLWSSLGGFFCCFLLGCATGELQEGVPFLFNNPTVLGDLAGLLVCSVMGQFWIFFVVHKHDPLTVSNITTFRKLLTVVWSVFFKGNPLKGIGFVGLLFGFMGVIMLQVTRGGGKAKNQPLLRSQHGHIFPLLQCQSSSRVVAWLDPLFDPSIPHGEFTMER